jgi:CopG antitoxin of type II toxin-antitoxin system
MAKGRASTSQATTYEGIGEFWDTHDLADFWEGTEPADLGVELKSERFFYSIERELADRISSIAHTRGVSPEALVNLWLQEKVRQAT